MSSFIAWLDYSERDRRNALDVIDMFKEQDTRDELGLGGIRDAFADRLFPGISTIQTRARYFLFIPWIYGELERKRVSSAEVAPKARKQEVALIDALVKAGDRDGIIGIEKRAALKRLPSNIYWHGLGRLGIRLFASSQEQYHASLDGRYRANAQRVVDDDSPARRATTSWNPGMPPCPPDFPGEASFKLTRDEAEYLRERIITHAPHTLLAYLVSEAEPSSVGAPWEHPEVPNLPPGIAEDLRHARNFAESIQGAALLYNLMLSEKAEQADLAEDYRARIEAYTAELVGHTGELAAWDRARFWQLVGAVPFPTRTFVDAWLDLVLGKTAGSIVVPSASVLTDSGRARELIRDREKHLKKAQARLENETALRLWNGSAGAGLMTFRWSKAQAIANDILRGLKGSTNDA